jgi:hypothetical protein
MHLIKTYLRGRGERGRLGKVRFGKVHWSIISTKSNTTPGKAVSFE